MRRVFIFEYPTAGGLARDDTAVATRWIVKPDDTARRQDPQHAQS